MGNKKGLKWYLILYTDESKKEIFKIIKCKTIKEMSYYLDIKSTTICNFYHKQIKPRGVLKLIGITQNYKM